MSRRRHKNNTSKHKKYTLGQKILHKTKKTATKLNRGFEKKLKQTERNIRKREYSRERYTQWKRRQEAQTVAMEKEAGIEQPSVAERIIDKKNIEAAQKMKERFKAKSNIDPAVEGGAYLNDLLFGKKRK